MRLFVSATCCKLLKAVENLFFSATICYIKKSLSAHYVCVKNYCLEHVTSLELYIYQ